MMPKQKIVGAQAKRQLAAMENRAKDRLAAEADRLIRGEPTLVRGPIRTAERLWWDLVAYRRHRGIERES